MSLLRRGLSLAWEAPQTALGVGILAVEAARKRIVKMEVEDGRLVIESTGTGISLGHIVFWSRENSRWHDLDLRNRAHELGHAKQSRLLGWLYLPVIGLPSISRAAYALAFREVTGRQWTRYYEGYPEDWADRLGDVVRVVRRGRNLRHGAQQEALTTSHVSAYDTTVPAPVTTDLVWKEIEKRSFAVLSYVNPKGRARSSGVIYVPIDRVLYVRVAKKSWKAKHIRLNPHVALNVTIKKRVPFMPWIEIPDATIAFSGTARVLSMSELEPELRKAILGQMIERHGNLEENCLIEIRPAGHFATYGVGVSLLDMRDPEKARGRTPVG